jgi:protein required for attachment to host cells
MSNKRELLVLVADGARGELLRHTRGAPPFETVATFSNPDARLPDRKLGESRPGRAHESVGPRRSAIEPRTTPRTHALIAFADALAAALDGSVKAEPGTRLVLAAPPRLLRMIEARLPSKSAAAIARTVPKDLTRLPRLTLQERLSEMIATPA